jgi:hypothetical protein
LFSLLFACSLRTFYLATPDADAPSPLVGAGCPPLVAPPLSCLPVKPPTAVLAWAGPVPPPLAEAGTSDDCGTIPAIGEEELAGSELDVALELEIGLEGDAGADSRSQPAASSEMPINANVQPDLARSEFIELPIVPEILLRWGTRCL